MLTPELEKRIRSILDWLRLDKIEINHTMRLLGWEIDQDNVNDVMEIVPPKVHEALKELVAAMPHSDAEWEQWIDLYATTLEFLPTTPPEQIVQWQQEAKRDTRRGIEALRSYFERHAV